ncbi:MAG: hypothetical protein ACI364_07030 [Coriobacteriales bacterium]
MSNTSLEEYPSSEEIANAALNDVSVLDKVVEAISGDNRRMRQRCAGALAEISRSQPELLIPYAHDLADALHRPEARTRWECLDALTNIVPVDARACDRGFSGAEASLFDEESNLARLSAFRFLAAYGATTENRASRVWPLLDEAIQCYHGDPEYPEMLASIVRFAQGKASREVKDQLVSRLSFDAENGHGLLGRRSKEAVEAAQA